MAAKACDETVGKLIEALAVLTPLEAVKLRGSGGDDADRKEYYFESRPNPPLAVSRSTSPQAGSPLTGFDRATRPPGNCTE